MPGGSAKKYWKFPRCLKLTRILRPNRIITFLDVRDYMKLYLKLLKTIFYLVIYLHIVACLWFLIVDTDDKWVPPLDYPFAETHLYERDRTYKYLWSLYNSVLILGGGEMGPRGVFQLIFIIVFIIAGALINATLFSELAVIVAQLNLKMTRFQEKLDIANSMCINLGLPNSLRKNVQAYLTQTEKVLYSLEEIHVFMDMLSPSLKEEVLYCTFSNLLSKNPKFVLKDHVLRFLTKRLSLDMVEPEEPIIIQNEEGEDFYLISNGH